jgi:hypothetical protein
MSPEDDMFFSKPVVELPKITAPTAAEIAEKSKPSAEGKALLKADMKPAEYQAALEKNKMSVDSVHFLAHGLPAKDAICWACQGCGLVRPKLSMPELDCLKFTEAWLKNPLPELMASISLSLGKVDFKGPGGWAAQAAMWMALPALCAAAVAGAILLCGGLAVGVAMPPIPNPRLQVPMIPFPPELLLQFQKPPLPPIPPIPVLNQPKLMKMLFPFIDLGKGVAIGSIKCC